MEALFFWLVSLCVTALDNGLSVLDRYFMAWCGATNPVLWAHLIVIDIVLQM